MMQIGSAGRAQVPRPAIGDLVRARFELGEFEVTICSDGVYHLDGGAMFGVVPKTLWEKRARADALNRIALGLNTVVVRTGKHTVLIETGIGNKQTTKMREIHGNQELLPSSLAAAGIGPAEVDIVLNTHLHFDHCGWEHDAAPGRIGYTDLSECALLRREGRGGARASATGARCDEAISHRTTSHSSRRGR